MFEEPTEPPEYGGPAENPADDRASRPAEPSAGDAAGDEVGPLAALTEAQALLQRAEAARLTVLLDGYDEAMAEFTAVFGADAGDRGGPFARSFLLEAAQVLHLHERTAGALLDAGHALRRSFPCSWAVLVGGSITWREAELVWRQAQGLAPDRVAEYDAAAAELLGAVPVPRLKERLHRLRERLQANTAVSRHEAAATDRCVRVDPAPDGMAWLSIYGEAAEILAFDDALTKAAVAAHGDEDETRTLAQLRHDITRDLLLDGIAVPSGNDVSLRVKGRKAIQQTVFLTIPVLTALGRTTEPATLAGYGPIDVETAKELASGAKGWIRILTDPVSGVRLRMDRTVYSPPPDLRRWLQVRDETCRAPGCNRRAATCGIDHVAGWAEDGRTEDHNLAHLCRRHHRVKGSGYWRTSLHPDGRMRWRSWWDRTYVTEPAAQTEPMTG